MDYLYILITISTAVFALYTVFTQIRLNRHTDTQAKFFIAAKQFNFSPYRDMAKKTLRYFLLAAALLFVLTGGAAAAYGIINGALPDLLLTLYVYAASLAAYVLNTALLFYCAAVYVGYKMRTTPVM